MQTLHDRQGLELQARSSEPQKLLLLAQENKNASRPRALVRAGGRWKGFGVRYCFVSHSLLRSRTANSLMCSMTSCERPSMFALIERAMINAHTHSSIEIDPLEMDLL